MRDLYHIVLPRDRGNRKARSTCEESLAYAIIYAKILQDEADEDQDA